MSLKVVEEKRGEWTVLRVSGEMDLVTSPAVRQHVHAAVADGRHSLVLDLSDVLFCDSSGVGVLIASRRLMRSCAGRLRLILPAQGAEDGSHVNRVLAALGVRRLFDCYPDLAAATGRTAAAGPLSARPAPCTLLPHAAASAVSGTLAPSDAGTTADAASYHASGRDRRSMRHAYSFAPEYA